MKAYPEYKPSNIDWLSEIPSHWNRMPLKAVLCKSSAGTWGEEANEDDSDIVCYRVADFDYPHLQLSDKNLTYRSVDERQFLGREVNKGDIVIEKSGGGDLWPVGRAVISKFDFKATCSNFMHVISSNEKANNFFLNYLLATIYMHGINRQFFAQTTGIQNLNIREYLSQYVYFPPIVEQEVIAAYLDDVTGKVDTLIAEKQKQVEDLRAYRTSLITETVTRGLNPNAPLRSSGIDWLGEIPSDWSVVKLKYALSEIKDGTHFSPDTCDEGYAYVTATDVRGVGIDYASTKKVNESNFLKLRQTGCEIFKDDVLLVKDGATTGRVGYKNDEVLAVTLSSVAILRVKKCDSAKYLMYLLESKTIQSQISDAMAGAAMPRITLEKLGNFIGIVPPISEQQAIAEFLDKKTEKIDALIDELTKQLDELAEYKKAVISEAVTGKVDVRDWTPKS